MNREERIQRLRENGYPIIHLFGNWYWGRIYSKNYKKGLTARSPRGHFPSGAFRGARPMSGITRRRPRLLQRQFSHVVLCGKYALPIANNLILCYNVSGFNPDTLL